MQFNYIPLELLLTIPYVFTLNVKHYLPYCHLHIQLVQTQNLGALAVSDPCFSSQL